MKQCQLYAKAKNDFVLNNTRVKMNSDDSFRNLYTEG